MVEQLRQAGLSLVELMVSLLLGMILILGVTELYVSSKVTYSLTEQMSTLQENARIAFEMLVPQVRMAGYTGCANVNTAIPNVVAKPPVVVIDSSNNAIKGHEAVSASSWSPTLTTNLVGNVLANTDVMTLQTSGSCDAWMTGNMTSDNANIQINPANTCSLAAGDTLILSDCASVDIFKATNVSASSGGGGGVKVTIAHANSQNTSNRLSKAYGADAEIYKPISTSYYLKSNTHGVPALYRLDNVANNLQELVEGVENMQVLYGMDTDVFFDGQVNQYKTADAVGPPDQWSRVLTVRINLLMRSLEEVHASPTNTTFAGITYSDNYLRQEYTATVQLRNRSLEP